MTRTNVLFDRLKIANEKAFVVHKLLVTRPHRTFALCSSLHGPLLFDIKEVNLPHRHKVHNVFWADCYPRGGVLFLSILQPFVVPAVDGHRFVVGEHLPLCGTLCPRVATSIVEPPKALVLELSRLIDLH